VNPNFKCLSHVFMFFVLFLSDYVFVLNYVFGLDVFFINIIVEIMYVYIYKMYTLFNTIVAFL
jgi:hypothetical protein